MKRKRAMQESGSDEEIWNYSSGKCSKLNDGHRKVQEEARNEDFPIIAQASTSNPARPRGKRQKTGNTRDAKSKATKRKPRPQRHLAMSQSSAKKTTPNPKKTDEIGSVTTALSADPTPAKSATKSKPTGNCPFCQMPFCALTVDSPRWHVMECMDLPINAKLECPSGTNCDCTIPSHYRRFQHTVLAKLRAGADSNETAELQIETVSRRLNFSFKPSTSKGKASCSSRVGAKMQTHSLADAEATESQEGCVSPYFKKSQDGSSVARAATRHSFKLEKFQPCDSISSSPSLVSGVSMFKDSQEDSKFRPLSQNSPGRPFGSILSKPSHKSTTHAPNYPTTTELSSRLKTLKAELDSRSYASDEDIFQSGSEDNAELRPCVHSDTTNEDSSVLLQFEADADTQVVPSPQMLFDEKDLSELLSDAFEEDEAESATQAVVTMTPISAKDKAAAGSSSGFKGKSKATTTPGGKTPRKTTPHSKKKSMAKLKKGTTDDGPKKQTSLHSFFKCVNTRPRPTKGDEQPLDKQNKPQSSVALRGHNSEPVASTSKSYPSTSTSNIPSTSMSNKSKATSWPRASSTTSNVGLSSTSGYSSTDSSAQGSETGRWGKKRPCPFYKKVEGTPFVVDAFHYGTVPGVKGYFLTHFHYDHYGGLTKSFAQPLYCGKITANLVQQKIRVNSRYMHALPMNTPSVIEGVEVTLLEANHCPGSVLFLFRLRDGKAFLHTGDFRANQDMERYPQLQGVRIDLLYLDTTYCDPAYAFPPQTDVINLAVNIATDFVHLHPNALVVVGSYTIGKERIFMAIAEALNSQVCVTREKKNILDCLEDAGMAKRITLRAMDARVHVLPMRQLNEQDLRQYLGKLKPRYDHILAFEPTGWTHSRRTLSLTNIRPRINDRDGVTLYGVPYSEHSSYAELERFVQFTRPGKILPTVNNGNPASRKKMEDLFHTWLTAGPKKTMKQTALNSWFTAK